MTLITDQFSKCLTKKAIYSIDNLIDSARKGEQYVEIILNENNEDDPSITCKVSFDTGNQTLSGSSYAPSENKTEVNSVSVSIVSANVNDMIDVDLTDDQKFTLETEIQKLITKHI